MRIRIQWVNPNFGEEEIRVYADTSSMDPMALPTPLATLGPGILEYIHDPVTEGLTYYYIVSVVVNGTEYLSAEISQAVGTASIAAFFSAGEKGIWYDPSDLSTLFQDTAGTVPVTADGDPVRKLLDKSGNAIHLTNATGVVYKTDGVFHWLQFSGTYLAASGTRPSLNFAHRPGGYTGCFGVQFGIVADPNAAYVLYSNAGATSNKIGINGLWDDRASVPRNQRWYNLMGRGVGGSGPIDALTADNFLPANTPLVFSEIADPGQVVAADRHGVRIMGNADINNNLLTNPTSSSDPSDEFHLGAASPSGALPMTGRLYQFVLVEGVLIEADRAQLESIVSGKVPA